MAIVMTSTWERKLIEMEILRGTWKPLRITSDSGRQIIDLAHPAQVAPLAPAVFPTWLDGEG
jgi:hypothetical protein